jgi:GH25 family lysozyme M1 (1,4-beta-N-acetylmuramidase)
MNYNDIVVNIEPLWPHMIVALHIGHWLIQKNHTLYVENVDVSEWHSLEDI